MVIKKLIYILHSITIGGVEVALLSAIPSLMDNFDLSVIVLGSIDENLISSLTTDQQKVFIQCPARPYSYWAQTKKASRIVLNLNPDIVICSLWRAAWVGSIVKKKRNAIKLISFIHSTRFPHLAAFYFNKTAIKAADLVLADSISAANFVEKTFKPTSKVKVVSFLTGSSPEIAVRTELDLNRPIRFLFLGSIRKVKNVDIAIKVVNDLKKLNYDVSLDIYGRKDNGYLDAEKLVDKLDLSASVKFRGPINPVEKINIFSQYHFLIQLSSYEGMAMSVAEAMQYGVPCIVTPVGEIPNYSEDGTSAIFFDIQNWDLSLKKIVDVISNSEYYKQISKNCFETFRKRETYKTSLMNQIKMFL